MVEKLHPTTLLLGLLDLHPVLTGVKVTQVAEKKNRQICIKTTLRTYQYGVPTKELAGAFKAAEPKSAEMERKQIEKLSTYKHIPVCGEYNNV